MANERSTAATTAAIDTSALAEAVRREVRRTMARSIKGLDYLSTGDPGVGLTAKDTIHRRGTLRLYHYRPRTDEVYRVPVLLIMSLVSKPYILDLAPGQSMVEFLLDRGFDVYMIDWGTPTPEDKVLRLEDYVLDRIPDCIERVLEHSGERELSLVGYCMGGLLSVLYQALEAGSPLRNLACFATPIDFDGMELFKRWTDPRHFDVDKIVDTLGNVPPQLMYASFNLLRPVSQAVGRVRLWDNMWNDEFVTSYRRFDRWAADQIPFPGECFRQVTKELQQRNKLLEGTFELAGRRVDLASITVPTLHVLAEHDHIVPRAAASALIPAISSQDKQEIVLKGGHVSLVAGANAVRRLWPKLEHWLAHRSI
ncbi:MAG: alpha/beta fold hydrolase [Acidobacteria bacterium]|mgnify:CR=1 FL=1|nr:MAG: alpha/beta fold hydrolase [Acidobacteriota bacterium]REK07265.1 MAG: alpha/beta fold hydrolase [Acidobacteriota bacterium]